MRIILLLIGCSADAITTTGASQASVVTAGLNTAAREKVNDSQQSEQTRPPFALSMKEGEHPCQSELSNAHANVTWVQPVEGVVLSFTLEGQGLNGSLSDEWRLLGWDPTEDRVWSDGRMAQHCWTEALVLEDVDPAIPASDERVDLTNAMYQRLVYPRFSEHQLEVKLPIRVWYVVENKYRAENPDDSRVVWKELDRPAAPSSPAKLLIDLALPPGEYTFKIAPETVRGSYKAAEGTCKVDRDGDYHCDVEYVTYK